MVSSSMLRTQTTTTVRLNVYDLHQANEFVSAMGFGLYHSGVEIDGREYVYGGGSGIVDTTPRTAPNAIFRVAMDMGSLDGGSRAVARAIDDLRPQFPESGYDLISRNCNHFADALIFALFRRHIPSWINRAALLGSCVACLVPRARDPTALENGGGGGGGGWRPTGAPARPPARSFKGAGYTLAPSTPPRRDMEDRDGDQAVKRDRIRNAALRRFDCSPD